MAGLKSFLLATFLALIMTVAAKLSCPDPKFDTPACCMPEGGDRNRWKCEFLPSSIAAIALSRLLKASDLTLNVAQ